MGTLPGDNYGGTLGINDAEQVVGASAPQMSPLTPYRASGPRHAVLWDAATKAS